jgi:hypothetical protein
MPARLPGQGTSWTLQMMKIGKELLQVILLLMCGGGNGRAHTGRREM